MDAAQILAVAVPAATKMISEGIKILQASGRSAAEISQMVDAELVRIDAQERSDEAEARALHAKSLAEHGKKS